MSAPVLLACQIILGELRGRVWDWSAMAWRRK
jgi:hypothetical protein